MVSVWYGEWENEWKVTVRSRPALSNVVATVTCGY